MKFSYLRGTHNDLLRTAIQDEDYVMVQWIRSKFIEYQLETWDTFSWKLINDYLVFREFNAVTKGQKAKVAELIIKYGPSSLMWEHLEETRMQRGRDLDRLMNAVRAAIAHGNDPVVKARRKDLSLFLRGAVSLRRCLLVNHFTMKQRGFLCKIERILGIYYDDLSPEENGIVALEGSME